jgi:hypothetical protein
VFFLCAPFLPTLWFMDLKSLKLAIEVRCKDQVYHEISGGKILNTTVLNHLVPDLLHEVH